MCDKSQRMAELRMELAELEADSFNHKDIKIQLWKDNYKKLKELTDPLFTEEERTHKKGLCNVIPRRLGCYYMRKDGLTYQTIANIVGVTKHVTAMYHCEKAEEMLDPRFGDELYRLVHKEAKVLGICTI